MRHMNLHRVKACLHSPSCRFSIAFYQFINLLCRNSLRNIRAAFGSNRGRCLNRSSGVFRISVRACILQLYGNLSPCGMDCIRHTAEALNRRIIINTGFSGAAFCALMYNGGFADNQAEATLCPRFIICCRLFAHRPVCIGKIISHGRHYKTVFYCHWTNLNWLKHKFKFHYLPSCHSVLCRALRNQTQQAPRVFFRIIRQEPPARLPPAPFSYCRMYALQLLQCPEPELRR